jgi:hypothetical protein
VTPILYLSNGVRYPLRPVTLQPSGTSIVDINQGLAQQGIAPYATLYGYAEIEYQWPWAIVSGRIRNVDAAHSLIFLYELQPALENLAMIEGHASKQGQQNLEGMWWKYEPGVNGFMAFSNITAKAINASLRVTDDHDVDLETYQLTVLPHTTKLVTFNELLSASATAGGIYVSHDGPAHALVVNGGLEDQQKGYSANLSLPPAIAPVSPADPSKVSEMSFAEAGLMIGAADPMMHFPAGTEFIPYSVVRNTSSQSASIKPTFWWMDAGKPRSTELSQISIAPHQTVNLNVPSLIAAAGLKGFSGSVNLVLDTTALPGALSLASGSVDKTDTYVFEVTPHGIAESASRAICYWSTGNGDDTMITVWNPADEPQDFAFTLFYSSGHYVFPIHLEARATQTFNISDLIRNQLPDAAGNIIPLAVHEGSAELAGSQAENQQILVSMSGGTYNVNKAICGVTCITCNGVVSDNFFVADNPFNVAIAGTKQQTFYEQWNNGAQYSISANWNSSPTSVATVGSTTGLVTGVAPGSVGISAQDQSTTEPMYVANYCTPAPICPVYYYPSGQSGGYTGAVPTNFHIKQWTDAGGGDLFVVWAWDSSTGNKDDLSACTVSESVSYPGTGDYAWPTPFPAITSQNPTPGSVPASDGEVTDDHDLHGKLDTDFRKPYSANSFAAHQTISYNCSENGKVGGGTLLPSTPITRSVSHGTNWSFTVTENALGENMSATINPLP